MHNEISAVTDSGWSIVEMQAYSARLFDLRNVVTRLRASSFSDAV